MWWMYVLIVLLIITGLYGFVTLTRAGTARLTSRTQRKAEDMYSLYDDTNRRHRR